MIRSLYARARANVLGRNVYVNYDILRIGSYSRARCMNARSEIKADNKCKNRSSHVRLLSRSCVCGSCACKCNHVRKPKSYFPSAPVAIKSTMSSHQTALSNTLSITVDVFAASFSFFRKYTFTLLNI